MDTILAQYVERLRRLESAPRHVKNVERILGEWDEYLDGRPPSPPLVEEWLCGQQIAHNTRKHKHATLRAAYRYAQALGQIKALPTVDVRWPKEPAREPEIVPIEELRAMKALAWQAREVLLFHLLAYTGMRRGEIATLRGEDIDLANRTIRVLGHKTQAYRYIPIHPALAEVLVREPSSGYLLCGVYGDPLSMSGLQYALRRLTRYPYHSFRRTVTSSLRRNGVEGHIVDKILGWAPRDVQHRHYVRVADEELHEAILKLYADDPL